MAGNGPLGLKIARALAASSGDHLFSFADGRAWSGRDALAASGQKAAALLSLGIATGDRVMVQAHKSAEALALYLAIVNIGAIFTPVPLGTSTADVESFIDDAQPTVLVAPEKSLAQLARKLRMSRVRAALSLEADGTGTLLDLASRQQPARTAVLSRLHDPCLIRYGQAVGLPGGVIFSQAALIRQGEIAAALCALEPHDSILHGLHRWWEPASLAFLLAGLFAGTPLAWMRSDEIANTPAFQTQASVAILDGQCALVPDTARLILAPDGAAGAPASAMRFLVLPETGLYAVRPEGGPGHLLPTLQVRALGGMLSIHDACLFSGYWRRATASRNAFADDGSFTTSIPIAPGPDGLLLLTPQP